MKVAGRIFLQTQKNAILGFMNLQLPSASVCICVYNNIFHARAIRNVIYAV